MTAFSGTTQDPKLAGTYTPAAGGGFAQVMMIY